MSKNNISVRIYDETEHEIWKKKIDSDVLAIIKRIRRHGYKAYIVGGAIRDLLLGLQPKDYDLVTNGTPAQIRKLFHNCRIIGRRFRLIHIFFANNKIIELATFRTTHDINAYGRIEQDVFRRDFTFNALYYDPKNRYLIDYVNGYRDLKAKKLTPIIPTEQIFKEDPVRMIRAVKYAVGTTSTIPHRLSRAIRRDAHLLSDISYSRLTEEFNKIFLSGKMEAVFLMLHKYALLHYLQPEIAKMLQDKEQAQRISATLQKIDQRAAKKEDTFVRLSVYLRLFPFQFRNTLQADRLAMVKKAMAPVTLPNYVMGKAAELLYKWHRRQRKATKRVRVAANEQA